MEEGLLGWFYSCSDSRVAVYLIVSVLLPLSAYVLARRGMTLKDDVVKFWPKLLVSAGVLTIILEWSTLGAIPLLVGNAAVAYDPLLLFSPAAFLAGILGAVRLLIPVNPYGKNDFISEVCWFLGFCASAMLLCAWIRSSGHLIWGAAIQVLAVCWLGRSFLLELQQADTVPAPAAAGSKPRQK